jgi:HTH-type transcriptional regulator, competence development regulator
MTFGERIRQLRREKNLTLRGLAAKVGVGFTYISKIENGKLDFDDDQSEGLIRRLAKALDADLDELLLLAEIVPDRIRKRVLARPDAFLKLAELDDRQLDRLMGKVPKLKQ